MMFAPPSGSHLDLLRMVTHLNRLVEISLTLNSTLDQDELLQSIIETAAQVLECEAASILLFNENTGELRFAAATGSDPQKLSQIPVPLDQSIAGTIFRENRPLCVDDVSDDPRHYTQVGEQVCFQTRSLLGVPMRIRDQVTGVLEALNKTQGSFTEEDIQLLSVIASQAAVAIHNARLIQELQQAYAEISRVDQIRSNFLALASHELRTPLSIILGYATFLQEESQGVISGHATQVLNAANQMRSVLEAMSNMTLMSTGSMDLVRRRSSLQELLELTYTETEALARAKNQTLRMNLPQETVWLNVDAGKIQKAFTNLLHNAIRFTPEGGRITVDVVRQPGNVQIRFQDTGIGIRAENLEKIFEEFYQGEHHLTRHYGGLGLGLTIARGLIELHGGKLWAESPGEGQGACLIVELPMAGTPALG